MRTIIFVTIFCQVTATVTIPENFQKCYRNRPDFVTCLLNAANHGAPQLTRPFKELGLPNMSPLFIKEVTVGESGLRVAIEQKFQNCEINGLTSVHFTNYSINFEGLSTGVEAIIPNLRNQCEYEMRGQVLLLRGNLTVSLRNLKVAGVYHYEEKRKKGKTYIHFLYGQLDIDADFLSFKFDSSIGDIFTKNINKVFNEDWKAVFEEVKPNYAEVVNQIVLSSLNNFYSRVSLEEAFD